VGKKVLSGQGPNRRRGRMPLDMDSAFVRRLSPRAADGCIAYATSTKCEKSRHINSVQHPDPRRPMKLFGAIKICAASSGTYMRAARLLAIGGSLALVGCATYRPLPLPSGPDLATTAANLSSLPPALHATSLSRKIDLAHPVSIDRIGLLAVTHDPSLKSERGQLRLARSGVLQATLLPNPAGSFDYGALISGSGTTSSVAASLSEDIVAILTRGSRIKSAEGRFAKIDAEQLWREWQVAQKARQLAVDIYWGGRAIALTTREQGLLKSEIAQVRQAVSAGNLTLSALAPLLSADASAAQSLVTLQVNRLKNWQALDGLMGLDPDVRFSIARPRLHRLPRNLNVLIATLPDRRPDLLALQYGYRSAEQDVRAAIIGQFPALSLGGSYGSDTSNVVTAGPSFGFALPLFDHNQGHIAKARATRTMLREQYAARLDTAVGNIHALVAQISRLSRDLRSARKAAASAKSLARTARKAYGQHNLDQRSLTDYERTALQRTVQVVDIERQLGEDRVFLAVELGIDVPHRRIALGTETRF
jgi:outer membrane protein, heavy metal efflux system